MRNILFVFILILTIKVSAEDCKILNPPTEDLSEYYNVIIDSLINLKSINADFEIKNNTTPTDVMVKIKSTRNAFECSYDKINSFSKSKVKGIADNSKVISEGYKNMSKQLDTFLKDLKNILDGKKKDSPGVSADKESDRIIQMQKNWKYIAQAIINSMEIVLETTDPNTKKIVNRFITKEERDELVNKLKNNFTLPVKENEETVTLQIANFMYEAFIQISYNESNN